MASIGTLVSTQTIIARTAGALFGIELGSTSMNSLAAAAGSTTASQVAFLNTLYANSVGVSTANSLVVSVVMSNLGIPTTDTAVYTGVSAYLQAQLDGAAYTARGGVLNDFLTLFSTLTASPYVTAYNTKIATAEAYAAVSTNTSNTTFASISSTPSTAGTTFTLTSTTDTLTGTAQDDVFIGDYSGTATINASDTLNGGSGNDTFKIYGADTSAAGKFALPASLSSIEVLNYSGATLDNTNKLNTNVTGVTSVILDNVTTKTGAATVQLATNATLTLKDNVKANFAQKLNVDNGSDTAATLILQNFNDNGSIIDFNGTVNNVATLNIQSILGAAATANTNNTATINNTGAKITAINISGDQKATFVLQTGVAGAAKTINASTSTGGVSVDTSADAKASTFAFTGGAGNDTLMLKAGDLTAIAAGGQIDFGAGTNDKIVTLDTTFAAADYAKLNAIKNVEVLGTGAAAAVVDASQLTSIKNFSIDGNGIQAYTKMAAGATVTDTSATHAATLSFGGDVGVNTLNLILGADSKAAGIAIGGNLTIGQTTVSLVSNGDGTATNTISALKNADNSTYTITGSNDLTITATQATAIGSKYDGSAATGKLNITGNTTGFSAGSALGDVIIGGSKADTLKAAVNGGTLTGNGGNDQFDVSAAVTGATAATAAVTTITDFTKGDSIKFTGTASTFVSTKVDTSAAGSLVAAIDAIAASTTANSITWGVYGGNTYVVDNIPTTAGGLTATDVLVKLTGTLDLSTSTVATGTLTFA